MTMFAPPKSKPKTRGKRGRDYEARKERARQVQASQSAAGRDIGPIPAIANPERRAACRDSLRLFCETYNPEGFDMAWSPDHLRAIARMEEAATHGALFALAMPRGSGKTTLSRMAALWSLVYCLRRYVFVIGANAGKAQDTLEAIKTYIRFLPRFVADFPEIAAAAQALDGIANRAGGQLCQGKSTMIDWSKDRVVLPTVPPPRNWPADWPLRGDGMVPTSGSIIGVSGLTGDGIRGSLLTLTTGESIRPDFVLLDDPQTDESARSPSQNVNRERLVSGAVLGMAGPGKTISAVMPCTVIAKGDFVDRILDRTKHPMWRGERTKMLPAMPTDLAAWDRYFEVYHQCAQKEPPDYTEANEYYQANRKELDKGASASWPARKLDTEISAIQHAMNLYCRDRHAFFAEYQNEPVEEAADEDLPTADEIAEKTLSLPRKTVPLWASHLTAFIDVQGNLLYWAVVAWGDGFTGHVVDYGAFPDQKRAYFTLREATRTLSSTYPNAGQEGQWRAGLADLCTEILGKEWKREGGTTMQVERCLIDAGYGLSTETVYRFCRESAWSNVLRPSKGEGVGASNRPLTEKDPKQNRVGHHWYEPKTSFGKRALQNVIYDTNHWKSFVFARLAQPTGDPGAMTLFKGDHRMFADQVCAEYRVRTEGRGRMVDEWKLRPGKPDNHFLDCIVGSAVAASTLGCRMHDHIASPSSRNRRKLRLSDLQKDRR